MNAPRYTGDELAVALNEIKILRGLYDGTKPLIEQYETELAAATLRAECYKADVERWAKWREEQPWLAEIQGYQDQLASLHEAVEACRVFVTPLERLKDWNEYKEDAAERIRATVGTGI